MEDIGNGWDDLIHDSFQYPADGMSRPETVGVVRNYDLELGSGLWTPQQRRADPLAAIATIGSIPQFESYSSKSSESSPMLSDDYIYSPDDLRRLSNSTVSSPGTISPKDAMFFSPDIQETMGYFSLSTSAFEHDSAVYRATPAPEKVIVPRLSVRPSVRTQESKPEKEPEPAPAAPSRRRPAKSTASSSSSTATKATGLSNNNNSKPMTARDRKRRQMHNASAMRSRIRLNECLDKMWKTIPPTRRRRLSVSADGTDGNEQMEDYDDDEEERIGRADKVEVGIDYIIHLEERVRELEERLGQSS